MILIHQPADVSVLGEGFWAKLLEEEIDRLGRNSKATVLEFSMCPSCEVISRVAIHAITCCPVMMLPSA